MGGKGGKGKGGAKKAQVVIEPHRHEGVFVCKGKDDALVTKNMAPGESVYGEKRISAEHEEQKQEYRVWNPFRSKLGATIVGGMATCRSSRAARCSTSVAPAARPSPTLAT